MKLPDFYEADLDAIEAALERLLPPEDTPPSSIHRAMRYSVFAGGKRIRPVLCLEAARMFTDNSGSAVQVGCALEFIHTYSLIHDDLPALDNDDLRRGKPTNHKVFRRGDRHSGRRRAADAGVPDAGRRAGRAGATPEDYRVRSRGRREPTDGMIGGQVADIEAERKPRGWRGRLNIFIARRRRR